MTSETLRYPPFAQDIRLPLWMAIILVTVSALLLLLLTSLGGFIVVVALAAILLLAFLAFKWPEHAMVGTLVAFILTRFLSLLVFAVSGSSIAVRASQLVKDELIVVLVFAVINLAFQRGRAPRLHYLDIVIFAYLGVGLLYFFYEGPHGDTSTSLIGKVLALRQDALYVLAYFIGRGLNLRRQTLVWMVRGLIGLSFVLALVAVFQFALPGLSNAAFGLLKFNAFMAEIGAPHETLVVRSRGIAGSDFPRASSLFLTDLGLAYYQLLVVPLAAALFYYAKRPMETLGYGMFFILMVAVLAMTITRSAVLAGALAVAFVLLRPSGLPRIWFTGLTLLTAGMAFVVLKGLSLDTFSSLLSSDEGSALAHIRLIEEAVNIVKSEPLGLGLGNGSHVANLLGSQALSVSAVESWYLQLAIEMGVVAAALFLLMLLIATVHAVFTSFTVSDPLLRVLTTTTAAAGIAVLFIGVLQPVWAAVHVTFMFWLLTGITMRARELEAEWGATSQAPPD